MASSGILKKTLKIDGMTCVSCENRIERKLQNTPGILEAKVSYSGGTAAVTYDSRIITLEGITEIIEKLDYKVKSAVYLKESNTNIIKTLGVVLILFALYMLASRFGVLNIFNSFPQAEKNTGYAMLFVIGLLTSVHCVAMCGGIGLSQCVPQGNADVSGGKWSTLRPSLLYNLGRVISYTVVGGVVGAIGSVVSFSGAFKGVVQLAAGIFMVIMGLNMLNLFPWLKKLNPRMPKIFARKINREKGRSNSPLYVGLLNGLMPCGPLQAMQLYALSTGSMLTGALSMFLFSLGTVPLMFGMGALSSILSKKFTHRMMRVSAVLVTVLGVFMFSSGMSLSGISMPSADGSVKSGNVAVVKDGVQLITTGLPSGRYEPITVQKGIPVKWTIQAKDGDINGCNNRIVIPKYNKELKLNVGDNVIEFTPTDSGVIPYSCWMGMIRSQITVVDDLSNSTAPTPPTDNGGAAYSIPTENIAVAKIEDGVQRAEITVDQNGFSPAVVVLQSGVETEWTINAISPGGGASVLLFPQYYAQIDMKEGANEISLVPEGDFDFSTADASFFGYVKVVDDLHTADLDKIRQEISEYTPVFWDASQDSTSLPSCH